MSEREQSDDYKHSNENRQLEQAIAALESQQASWVMLWSIPPLPPLDSGDAGGGSTGVSFWRAQHDSNLGLWPTIRELRLGYARHSCAGIERYVQYLTAIVSLKADSHL